MNPRNCPKCKNSIPIENGFHFDEKLNLVCDECKEIVFAVAEATPNYYANSYQNNYHQSFPQTQPAQQSWRHTPHVANIPYDADLD